IRSADGPVVVLLHGFLSSGSRGAISSGRSRLRGTGCWCLVRAPWAAPPVCPADRQIPVGYERPVSATSSRERRPRDYPRGPSATPRRGAARRRRDPPAPWSAEYAVGVVG